MVLLMTSNNIMCSPASEAEREFDFTHGVVTQGGLDVIVSMSWMLTVISGTRSVQIENTRRFSGYTDGLKYQMWTLGTKIARRDPT
jgi:hypothetical protein